MWVLHGTGVSLVLESPGADGLCAAPIWRYFGPRLGRASLPVPRIYDGERTPTFHVDAVTALRVVPVQDGGWFGAPALLAHRDGLSVGQGWSRCTVVEDADANALHILLVDTPSSLSLQLSVGIDPVSDVVTLQSRLTNEGAGIVDVQWLAAGTLPLPADADRVTSWHGRHSAEFVEETLPLGAAMWRRENRRGLTSHEAPPSALVMTADNALTFAGHLAWSGNSSNQIERCDDGRFAWQMGECLSPGEVRLGAGESLTTPQWLVTCSYAGRNGAMQTMHRALRGRVDWPGGAMRPRPVHINSWEAFYFDHDVAALMRMADRAAALGVERFVLDDGWFTGRTDDRRALGDWAVDPVKYPEGLGPLAAHVRQLGMEFGLWVEPEMVSPDSDLYRAHPDWALAQRGRTPVTARHQLVLDMANLAVAEHIFGWLSGLLRDVPINYLKWDHNRALGHAGDRAMYRAQVSASYALMARLRAAFPDVEIEACAAGGGRIDAGIARYCHRFWPSDCIDAVSRVDIQRHFLQFFPPEMMGAHVGAATAHTTRRTQSMAWRCAVALPGHFGVELDPASLSADDAATLAEWIALYKGLRDRLHSGSLWLGTGADGLVWQAHGDADDLILIIYRTEPMTLAHGTNVRLPMLDADAAYQVERVDPRGAGSAAMVQGGGWLSAAGLAITPMHAQSARVFRLTRQRG